MEERRIKLRIAQLREAKGITQAELAKAMNISYQSVSKWETGNAYPDITMLPKLSRYFGVSTDYILGLASGKETEYFIAVDQGGTKTRVLLCEFSGKIAGDMETEGSCWYYDGIDKAISVLYTAVSALLSSAEAGAEQVAFIVCGASGINWEDERGMYTAALERRTGIKAYVYNDCAAAVYCDGADYLNRIVLCAGTEFDAAVITPELTQPFVYCNYTMPCDMGGSEIGRRAVNAVIRSAVKLSPETTLQKPVLSYFGIDSVKNLHTAFRRGKLERHPKNLVPMVFEESRRGDGAAQEILLSMADNMSEYAVAAVREYRLQKAAVILAGGVFKNDFPPFYNRIRERILSVCPEAVVIRTDKEIVEGAYNLGRLKAAQSKR